MNLVTDLATGRWWAATIEEAVGHWWLVMWGASGQHLTAFYCGHWDEGGVYRMGRTPHELWPLMRETQHEGRRLAIAERVPAPPLLAEQLPDALWRAGG
ncbi:hypothetical protein ACFOY2_45960 [Nonomuraea purpurea]|uniref:GNAT family N-acetyltransferase n=1 Tax=Nonomuraea purpurea TaxID=1849276 RepID=A0ABV8GLE5_9ACTN